MNEDLASKLLTVTIIAKIVPAIKIAMTLTAAVTMKTLSK